MSLIEKIAAKKKPRKKTPMKKPKGTERQAKNKRPVINKDTVDVKMTKGQQKPKVVREKSLANKAKETKLKPRQDFKTEKPKPKKAEKIKPKKEYPNSSFKADPKPKPTKPITRASVATMKPSRGMSLRKKVGLAAAGGLAASGLAMKAKSHYEKKQAQKATTAGAKAGK